MLEPIIKGLIEWLYGLIEDIADYVFGDIIDVMTMDMDYFRKAAPIVNDISEIILALGWALLLGNLVFQALKSMMSGAGFDGEDPRMLFMRTFTFSFLLLASPQICETCSKMTSIVVKYLNIPRSFAFSAPSGIMFSAAGGVAWLIAIIVSIILIVQLIKLFFDIGERYVIACVLTFMAPLAFAMGGSKNTSDIFKGWCRMYGSMNLMLIMNIIFLKLIMNAMVNMWASNIIVWLVFVMALTRVARKIDAHIAKIGLNPAQTGNSVGVRFPGGMTMVVVRTIASLVGKNVGGMKGGSSSNNRSRGGGNNNNGGGRPRTPNPIPPSNNGGNASPTDTNVNVSVNNQSRTTRVNNNTSNTVNRQVNNATNNSRYTNNNSSGTDGRNNSRTNNSSRENSDRNVTSVPARNNNSTGNNGNVTISQTQIQNAAKSVASMPNTKPHTSPTVDRNSTATHDSSEKYMNITTYSSNQQRTQIPHSSNISRDISGIKPNITHPNDSNSTVVHKSTNSNSGKNIHSFNQSKIQNTTHPPLSRDISNNKPNTSRMSDRYSTTTHDSSARNNGRDISSSNRQMAQKTSALQISRDTSDAKVNIPPQSVSSQPHNNQSTVVNNSQNVNTQGGVHVNASTVKTGSKGVTVPVIPQAQSMSRISSSVRNYDNRSVNNNAVGNTSTKSDSDVHTSNISSNNGRTDRRNTVVMENKRIANYSSGNNADVNVNNPALVKGGNVGINVNSGGTHNVSTIIGGNVSNSDSAVNKATITSSDHKESTHYVANTNMNTTEKRVNPEYKYGRYDPAAANRKGNKNYYIKDTESLRRKGEYKRGESDNGGTAKKRNSEGGSRGTDRRRNN